MDSTRESLLGGRSHRGSAKKYSREFKQQALALVESSGKSISELERELGITVGLLHKWKARHTGDGVQAFPGNGRLKEEDEELRRLRRELEVVTQERDILKKALAIFSAERRR